MADKRAFAKFDVGYLDNPKMLDVLDASSNAIIMHFASVLYCAQHLTDGVVASKAMQRKSGGNSEDTKILVNAGLWHEENHGCTSCPQPPPGKVYVHDFLQHNRDSEAAKGVSKVRSKAASDGWAKRKAEEQIAMQNAMQTDAVCNTERERERENLNTLSSDADASDPEEFSDDVHEVCKHLADLIILNGNKAKIGKGWLTAADRLMRIDKYSKAQIIWVIDWSQRNEFWQGNILSMPKLREKFDQLKTRALAENAKPQPQQFKTKSEQNLDAGRALMDQYLANPDQLAIGGTE